MLFYRWLMGLWCVAFLGMSQGFANTNQTDFYRNFWYPTYHTQRLNDCLLDGKTCGLEVANQYCKLLGYVRAKEAVIDHNVRVTNVMSSTSQCKGRLCNGFILITCVGKFSREPANEYYYRLKKFAFPRFGHHRVDYCYTKGKGCGRQAADSFCRRMGYRTAQRYQKEEKVPLTQAIGNHQLCYGDTCIGFRGITCYR